jgi:hypothetical protein
MAKLYRQWMRRLQDLLAAPAAPLGSARGLGARCI